MGKEKETLKRFFNPTVIFILLLFIGLNFINGAFSNPMDWLMSKLLILPGILIGLCFHEFAHGAVSCALGDPTPKLQGRLTINPAAHLDPFGFLALLLAGFGWGVPVQIDPRYYKHRRRDELLVALAGVAMNLLIAIVFSFIIKGLLMTNAAWLFGTFGQILLQVLLYVIQINVVLMVFNLLPVPPLDGFGIITQIFNLQKYSWYYQVYDKGFLILLVLILLDVTDFVLGPCVSFVYSHLVIGIIL